jgi:vacuolar-type H+-ATPase subunit F/Vma7
VVLPLFIGDEITATGYRQAGIRTLPVAAGQATKAIERALGDTQLLLITPDCADELGAERLHTIMRRARPLLVIVPDAAGQSALPDVDAAVDRVLGIES